MHSRATRHLERTEVSGMELDYMMALCVKFERTSEKMEKLRAELDKHHDTHLPSCWVSSIRRSYCTCMTVSVRYRNRHTLMGSLRASRWQAVSAVSFPMRSHTPLLRKKN